MYNFNNQLRKYGSLLLINKNNIQQNYITLKNKILPAEFAAVLKNNAYGIGVKEVANILDQQGCNHYFVATLDEGINLRKISPSSNIYILHGIFEKCEKLFIKYKLIPVINSKNQLHTWIEFAKTLNLKLSCIIQFDTGINRMGLQQDEVLYFKDNYSKIKKYLNILYLISHFISQDNPESTLNELQYQRFTNQAQDFPHILKGLSASGGAYLNKKYILDMVRFGKAIYGFNPTPYYTQNPLKQVVNLFTTILKVNTLKAGEGVGYEHKWIAQKTSKVATISLGYGDILAREIKHSYVFISGYKAPIIGAISMDSMCVDITELPDSLKVNENMPVEVVGKQQSLDQFAQKLGILNLVTCSLLGKRYKKIYY